jgi:hypothetical protein
VNATDILSSLSAELDWVVWFKLSAIHYLVCDSQIRAMFRLPAGLDLGPVGHVVLSSQGHMVAPLAQSTLLQINEGTLTEVPRTRTSLLSTHRALFESLQPDEADCFAFGTTNRERPVTLKLVVEDGVGHARAIFYRQPSEHNYALLKAIGVEYMGGHWADVGFIALFRNRLFHHLDAASLANYGRAGNCNRFFLNHGEIDNKVERGLVRACEERTEWAKEKGLGAARELAQRSCGEQLAMTCQPPPPRTPFPRGDLVPLGFLLNSLTKDSRNEGENERGALREKLGGAKRGAFWAFHTNTLVTSTDSALVLQGMPDRENIQALECFSDGHGAYFPQLWSHTPEPGRMRVSIANAHWCQADFATTCLVRALRRQAGLPTVTPLEYLENHFQVRSGLFFANPYLTDWALACAVATDSGAKALRDRLLKEILVSRNADYSFGSYDIALSTSLAILALAALGCRGRLLRLSQLSLAEMIDPARGTWPECTPFYSTKKVPDQECRDSQPPGRARLSSQLIHVNGGIHELCWYIDTYRIISTAVAVMALAETCDVRRQDTDLGAGECKNKRYGCGSHAEYVAEFALHPYV